MPNPDPTQFLIDRPVLDFFKYKDDNDEKTLARRQYEAFGLDQDWRDEFKDYEHLTHIYDRVKSSDTDDGMPHFNMLRNLVSDIMGVILPNLPDISLVATQDVDPRLPEVERHIRTTILRDNVETNNALVGKILMENSSRLHVQRAIHQAAVYGSGIVSRTSDHTLDPRENFEARNLVTALKNKKLSKRQRKEITEQLTNNSITVTLESLDVRDCYWESGRKVFDKDMLRCSYVRWVDLNSLVSRYKDQEKSIRQGPWVYFYADQHAYGRSRYTKSGSKESGKYSPTSSEQQEPSTIGVITTWELVPVTYEVEDFTIEDFVLAKTVTAGMAVIDKAIITREGGKLDFEGAEFDTQKGAVRLPFVPYYIAESDDHPYGFSIVEQEELPEDAFNRIIAILMRYADRSLENTKIAVLESAAGEGDVARIEHGLSDVDTNVIRIKGNASYDEDPNINKIIQSISGIVPQPPPMLMQLGNYLLSNFQRSSSTLDDVAISRARSAAGKRAQIAAGDRPLLLPIQNVIKSLILMWEGVYDEVQSIYGNREEAVTVSFTDGRRKQVVINQEVSENIPQIGPDGLPVTDPELVSDDNPQGTVVYPQAFLLNSTQIPMRAIPEGFTGLPTESESRARILSLWSSLNWLTEPTARRLGLPKHIRDLDDVDRSRLQQQQEQMAAMQQLLGGQMPGQPGDEGKGGKGQGQSQRVKQDLNSLGALPQRQQTTPFDAIQNAVNHMEV